MPTAIMLRRYMLMPLPAYTPCHAILIRYARRDADDVIYVLFF